MRNKKTLLAIAKRGAEKEFNNPHKSEVFTEKFRRLQSAARKLEKELRLEATVELIEKVGYKEIEVKQINLDSVEGNVVFNAISKRGTISKAVVVFITNMTPKSIVEQKDRFKPYSWLINGEAYKNSKNVSIG